MSTIAIVATTSSRTVLQVLTKIAIYAILGLSVFAIATVSFSYLSSNPMSMTSLVATFIIGLPTAYFTWKAAHKTHTL